MDWRQLFGGRKKPDLRFLDENKRGIAERIARLTKFGEWKDLEEILAKEIDFKRDWIIKFLCDDNNDMDIASKYAIVKSEAKKVRWAMGLIGMPKVHDKKLKDDRDARLNELKKQKEEEEKPKVKRNFAL